MIKKIEEKQQQEQYQTQSDSLLNDQDENVEDDVPDEEIEDTDQERSKKKFVDSIIDGFRIQVASTNDLDFANSLSNSIKDKFNYETYIIFDSPNYKLRVGDFISRINAETIRVNLIKNGYDKSWIIRTKVYKK